MIWAEKTQQFIRDWFSDQQNFTLHTSGSTGKPKAIAVSRHQMEASALATINHLHIPKGATTLLCMNPDMVGGRMMLVRAIIGQWSLKVVPASSSPMVEGKIDFTAMVPLQVESLVDTEEGKEFLNRIHTLIIGGGAINDQLLQKVRNLKTNIYQTFGMTETLSHIALKRLNGENPSEYYQLIGDNEIRLNDWGCLEIKGTVTNGKWISTNDLVEIKEQRFQWLGRADLVVNSGGIKILIEPLEKKLSDYFQTEIILWKENHDRLGEQLVAMLKDENIYEHISANKDTLKLKFDKYHFPKKWLLLKNSLALTPSGKIDRSRTLELNNQSFDAGN
ncbi:AMP-binding protein [Roseivirga sp.]|uniref:AMP-binding protein n=1 Tax=Roseivirga sp. TaxID=1964215 RepID=UPI003B5264DB